MNTTIIYEQPLNEIIRVCLRLEQLFQQITHELEDHSFYGTRNVITCMINILQILDRPDLKAKLAKEITLISTHLSRYSNATGQNTEKSTQMIPLLNELSANLIESSGKIGYRLRDIELLNALRINITNPAASSGDMPLFHYWLKQTSKVRHATLLDWLSELELIKKAVLTVLELVRNNAKEEQKKAVHGFYQELLDPQSNLRMLRISIPANIAVYPEVSIGRHFLSIRLFLPNLEQKPTQYPDDLTLSIGYCAI